MDAILLRKFTTAGPTTQHHAPCGTWVGSTLWLGLLLREVVMGSASRASRASRGPPCRSEHLFWQNQAKGIWESLIFFLDNKTWYMMIHVHNFIHVLLPWFVVQLFTASIQPLQTASPFHLPLILGLISQSIHLISACGVLAGDVVEGLDPLELRELCLELCRELAPFELVEFEESSPRKSAPKMHWTSLGQSF